MTVLLYIQTVEFVAIKFPPLRVTVVQMLFAM